MEKEFLNEFGKKYGGATYLHQHQCWVISWYGYTTSLQIETLTNWLSQEQAKRPCTVLINDCSLLLSVWDDSIVWFSSVWLPNLITSGLQHYLHVARHGGFGEKIGVKLSTSLPSQLRFHSFDSKANAISWIEKNKTEQLSLETG